MNKMADMPPSKKKKSAVLRRYSVCSAHTSKKETSFICLTCIVAFCKTLCFGEYNMKNV
jgi:hypothetical protein